MNDVTQQLAIVRVTPGSAGVLERLNGVGTAIVKFERESLELLDALRIVNTATIGFEGESLDLLEPLRQAQITDQTSYDAATLLLDRDRKFTDRIGGYFKEVKTPLSFMLEAVREKERGLIAPHAELQRIVKAKLSDFLVKQERERRQIEEDVRKKQRQEGEEDKLKAAEIAEGAGASEATVEAILETKSTTPAPYVPPRVAPAAGQFMRDNWQFEVVDKWEFLKWVAKDRTRINYIDVNESTMNSLAKAQKEALNIPGGRAVNKQGLVQRRMK